ncbi:MAG TPA: NF038122 family metalloprotease [Blastocatellia bacterium]|nr:NF038122 family metalloprotease [Blastocatellia bacterium]
MSKTKSRVIAVLLLIALNVLFPLAPGGTAAEPSQTQMQALNHDHDIRRLPDHKSAYTLEKVDGIVTCRDATPDELRAIKERDQSQLRVISPVLPNAIEPQETGLKITLRGTPQLDSFPLAKQAFLRAAQTWSMLIRDPITIIIDVDFGPTRFGEPYPSASILGSTDSQEVGSGSIYPNVRSRLIAQASNAQEAALYNALPAATVPTDLGTTAGVFGPTALFRALGLVDPVADPAAETDDFGDPPSIGFNSSFSFDFDPNNGIDAGKTDFDAVAVHEIGHALGFTSNVGFRELEPAFPNFVSFLDLLRFRPGITTGTFATAPRIQSSGGVQLFFTGSSTLGLSTGRPDGSGGDGQQPSHWKDDDLTGIYIGIMDPNIGDGERKTILENDLRAFDLFGYQVGSPGPPPGDSAPVITRLTADLQGDILTVTGTATDPDGDIAQAQIKSLNEINTVVAQTAVFPVNTGTVATINFSFSTSNLNAFPTAVKASLVFIDRLGNQSAPVIADFSQADPGGPTIRITASNETPNKTVLTFKGQRLLGQLQVEINGVVVAVGFNNSNGKVKLKGSPSSLNLRRGFNRIRIRNGVPRSNIVLFSSVFGT